jgi:thiosulfate/3-mercaptopyruvate sulfurtransferase
MSTDLLVNSRALSELIDKDACVVVDCRFDLADADKAYREFLQFHIPGAHFAHLDRDLSSPRTDSSGRHPLPSSNDFAAFLSRIGWVPEKLLVAYDGRNNAMSVRLWWLMRYFGFQSAILNGGMEAWTSSGLPLEQGEAMIDPSQKPQLNPTPGMVDDVEEVFDNLVSKASTLLDARAPERYSGEIEPLDKKAGHIPGALNRPLGLNLDQNGFFKTASQLKQEFETLLKQIPQQSVVHYCGSGVTACHNQFAMELAGLTGSRVYPGSWSEWIQDDHRAIEPQG